jgi:hypothetical protein
MPLSCKSQLNRWARSRSKSPLSALLAFALSALILSFAPFSAFAQESSADRVRSLRGHLTEVQNSYARALEDSSESAPAPARVEALRRELGENIKSLVQKATSSDATLAVYRADADSTLDAIRAYEATLADGPGEATSYWNVLSDSDLIKLRDQARAHLNSLRGELSNRLPANRSLTLEFRAREVDGWLKGIDAEIGRRAGVGGQVRLKPIRGDLPAGEARARYPSIAEADGPAGRGASFQRQLALQVELRLHNSPGDATLTALRSSLPKVTPPSVGPGVSRGPPESVKVAQSRLQEAQLEEVSAVRMRDPVRAAKARAQTGAVREWLSLMKREPAQLDPLGLSETSPEHLISLREKWKNWYDHLSAQQRSDPHASVQAAIDEAESRIREIDASIERKLLPRPPPPGSDTAGTPPGESDPPKGPDLRAFERTWERQVAHLEVNELARARNELFTIRDTGIDEAATKAFHERVVAEATTLRAAFNETPELQHRLLVSGRGPESAEAGKLLMEARRDIQASAQKLLDFLNDPKLGAGAEAEKAKALIRDFARAPDGAHGSGGLRRALTSLEVTRDAVDAGTRGGSVEIQAVTKSGAAPSEFRIKLAQVPPTPDAGTIKRPTDYVDLYGNEKGAGTFNEVMQDLHRAPGGVVVDAVLPDEVARRVEALNVDVETGAVKVIIGGSSRTLKMRPDPVLARLAWAFVLDGRVPVIDLRPLQNGEAVWLYNTYGDKRLSAAQQNRFIGQLAALTSVNVNEALRNSPLVSQLVVADQLMFDLLPRNTIRFEGEDERYGLPLAELRNAFREDMGAELSRPGWQDALFSKSVIAVSSVRCEVGAELAVEPRFTFHLFEVSARGTSAIPLKASERWFAAHEQMLRALPQLSRLADFSALVALFRTAKAQNIPHNLDDLVVVVVPSSDSPRFILRRDQVVTDNWKSLSNVLKGQKR